MVQAKGVYSVRFSVRRTWFLLLCWFGPLATAPGQEPGHRPASLEDAQAIINAGDTLAKQRRYDDALREYKRAYECIVARIRAKDFLSPVDVKFLLRQDLAAMVRNELIEDDSSFAYLHHTGGWYALLGLVPLGFDLNRKLAELLSEQVDGYYDSEKKELRLVRTERNPRGWLGRVLLGPEFDAEEHRIKLAHELTHALADQHFDLESLVDTLGDHDDFDLAIAGLIEGEATLVEVMEVMGLRDSKFLDFIHTSTLAELTNVDMGLVKLFGGQQIRTTPPILREMLLFPYVKGLNFVAYLAEQGGWEAVDKAFLNPPVSSEQILHPEKYHGLTPESDMPQWIELPLLAPLVAAQGWRSAGRNTMGEAIIGILLQKTSDGTDAAEGWGGDRFELFERADGKWAIAWFTTWDSGEDAHEFAVACSQWLDAVQRHRQAAAPGLPKTKPGHVVDITRHWENASSPRWTITFQDVWTLVERREADVVVVHGFTESEGGQVAQKLWQSQKAPWRVVRRVQPANHESRADKKD